MISKLGRPKGSKNGARRMDSRICQNCGKEFWRQPSDFKRGRGKYCSKKCFNISKIGQKASLETRKLLSKIHKGIKNPPQCGWQKGNKFSFRKGNKPWNTGKICPQLSGENCPLYKGGIMYNGEYKMVLARNHPLADHHGYVMQSRLVMEKYLGRYLTRKEVVHHINEIKTDNRIKNLMLFPNSVEHGRYHMEKRIKNNLH